MFVAQRYLVTMVTCQVVSSRAFSCLKRHVKLSLLQTKLAVIKLHTSYQVNSLGTSESETNWNGWPTDDVCLPEAFKFTL